MSSVQACPAAGARPGGPAAAASTAGPPRAPGATFPSVRTPGQPSTGRGRAGRRRGSLTGRPPSCCTSSGNGDPETRARADSSSQGPEPKPGANTSPPRRGQVARVGAGPVGRGRADGSSAARSELAVASHPRPHTELNGHTGTFDAVVPCPRTRLFCLSVQILR